MCDISPDLKARLLRTNILTPKEAVIRGKIEGYCFSEHALRQWIKSGAIPSRQIGTGKKNLIFWDNIVRFLTCQDSCDNYPDSANATPVSGIRRI